MQFLGFLQILLRVCVLQISAASSGSEELPIGADKADCM